MCKNSYMKQPGRFGGRNDNTMIYFTIMHANLHTRLKELLNFRETNESIKKLITEIMNNEGEKKFKNFVKADEINKHYDVFL